jgi:hypothetical protein
MAGVSEAAAWADAVRGVGEKLGVRYQPIGGLNPAGGPVALCPGGTNRLTGQLGSEFWGASCDADERERGGRLFRGGEVLPGAVLAKAHMPDLAAVMPTFNVESLEGAEDIVESRISRNRVQFESIEFNRRFIATVPHEYDPVALRETFSPGFLDWVAGIEADVDFGVSERQLYFLWRLRERSDDEYELALHTGAGLFTRVCSEVEEHGVHTYRPGPWHAGLEPFPDSVTS